MGEPGNSQRGPPLGPGALLTAIRDGGRQPDFPQEEMSFQECESCVRAPWALGGGSEPRHPELQHHPPPPKSPRVWEMGRGCERADSSQEPRARRP